MIRNYLIVAWRSLAKHKLFSLINVLGLSLSMSVSILVLLRMSDAFSYDNFHPDSNNIYRIVSTLSNTKNETWRYG